MSDLTREELRQDHKKEEIETNMFDGDKVTGIKFNMPQYHEVQKMLNERRDQKAKADAGKAEIRLVPMEIVWAIAWIRMYGNRKYGDPDNWKTIEPERYRDALMRHLLAYISDPNSVDEESGYPHLWHAACNMAFLMHFDYGDMCHYDLGKAIDGQHHWTPCSLKLPNKEGEYLVTNDAGGMKNVEIDTFAHYEDDGKPFWMTSQNPIAWMPIPDVYEKKEEKHEQ